jgi:hypothetical protein
VRYAVHDYVRLLLTKTPANNLCNRKISLGEILMDIMNGWGCDYLLGSSRSVREITGIFDPRSVRKIIRPDNSFLEAPHLSVNFMNILHSRKKVKSISSLSTCTLVHIFPVILMNRIISIFFATSSFPLPPLRYSVVLQKC